MKLIKKLGTKKDKMDICRNNHAEIIYNGEICPLCVIIDFKVHELKDFEKLKNKLILFEEIQKSNGYLIRHMEYFDIRDHNGIIICKGNNLYELINSIPDNWRDK